MKYQEVMYTSLFWQNTRTNYFKETISLYLGRKNTKIAQKDSIHFNIGKMSIFCGKILNENEYFGQQFHFQQQAGTTSDW